MSLTDHFMFPNVHILSHSTSNHQLMKADRDRDAFMCTIAHLESISYVYSHVYIYIYMHVHRHAHLEKCSAPQTTDLQYDTVHLFLTSFFRFSFL